MEDEFCGAVDLEDGELWLPSDFFTTEEAQTSSTFNYLNTKLPFNNYYCMDNFNFLNHPSSLTIHNPLQSPHQLKPAVLYNSTVTREHCCCGTGTGLIGNQPVYQYQRMNPVDSFIGERAWALQNRVRPGGTGFFLPRVSPNGHCVRMGQGMFNRRINQLPPRMRLPNRRPKDRFELY